VKEFYLLISLFVSLNAFSHGGEKHAGIAVEVKKVLKKDVSLSDLENINAMYVSKVKPIFSNKCLSCHGIYKNKPWYHVIPGVKQLMNRDIDEAKEHMDMSNDFPFGGHGENEEDLNSLKESIKEDNMPPIQYKMMHWSSTLTKEEKIKVLNWINTSLTTIKKGE